jgi:hypothetical protein
MEPDGELPGDFQGRQRGAVVAPVLMHRLVADASKVVEQIDDIARVGCVTSEASKEVGLCFLNRQENAGACRDLLCQQLAELPQFHQAGYWIVSEIPLSERRHTDQCSVVPV